jgi:hypothetical protein
MCGGKLVFWPILLHLNRDFPTKVTLFFQLWRCRFMFETIMRQFLLERPGKKWTMSAWGEKLNASGEKLSVV